MGAAYSLLRARGVSVVHLRERSDAAVRRVDLVEAELEDVALATRRLATPETFGAWLGQLAAKEWVVHVKPPLGGPRQALRYLACYTHRVAISNGRLLDIDIGRLRFRYFGFMANRLRPGKATLWIIRGAPIDLLARLS